jgi:hypothetical protein
MCKPHTAPDTSVQYTSAGVQSKPGEDRRNPENLKREGRPHEPPVSYADRYVPKGRLAVGLKAVCVTAFTF